ncbi:hypothetical protein ATO6_16300 [Oceanicola sp. 22II-s10i]|nr:hypothetical protein ATO6_16300 [Oceanicola sp. 22II-s10i]
MSRQFDDRYGMTGIQMREHQDDPIYIQIFAERLCATVEDGPCPGRGSREFTLRAGVSGNFASSKDVFVAEGHFVTGISVCMNRREDKIKGIRLIARPINPDGTIDNSTNPYVDSFARPNCATNHWSNQVDCPANNVVVGLRAVYSHDSGAKGIQPVCAQINRPMGASRPGIASN